MRRGQYTLIEQVVLFTLGISITLGFVVAFNDLKTQVKTDMKKVQSELVAEYVASSTVELVESGADGRMEIPVPEEIAGEQYAVRLGDGGVLVQVAGQQALASMYGLTATVPVSGAAESGQGAVTITVDEGSVRLEGAQ